LDYLVLEKSRFSGGGLVRVARRPVKVAWLIPAFRQTSSTVTPSSPCRKMKAICCSLNRDFFMEYSSPRPGG
jgi:hypothetical protein